MNRTLPAREDLAALAQTYRPATVAASATLPGSARRAPSGRAQRRPEELLSPCSQPLHPAVPSWNAGASTALEGAGGAQRRDSAASNDRGRQENRDGEYQIGLREHRAGGYPAQVELYRDATFELSFGRFFDYYGRLDEVRDRVGLPFASGSVAATGDHYKFNLSYNNNTPLPVLWMYETSKPGGYQDSLFTVNAEFDATNADGLFGALGGTYEAYTRDAAGRITGITTTFSGVSAAHSLPSFTSLQVTFATNQRQIATLKTASSEQHLTYDARGLPASNTVLVQRWTARSYPIGGSPPVPPYELSPGSIGTFTYKYDALGRNTELVFPDGHRRLQVWNELGRLISRCYEYAATAGAPGSAPTRCYTAQHDEVGNPTLLTDPERACTITYDDLDRLESVTCTDGTSETYAYNALGALSVHAGVAVNHQRPRVSGGGSASAGLPATHGGQPVTVDAVGKVTALGSTTLEWNRLGRLTRTVQGGVTTSYGLDSSLRRVVKQVPGSPPEFYVHEGPHVALIAHDAPEWGGIDMLFGFDDVDHPLWLYAPELYAIVWYELDLIGNVRRLRGGPVLPPPLSNLPPLPTDLGGYKYTAFGKGLPADAGTPAPYLVQPLRWQARWIDGDTGNYDFRNRVWSPDLAAFLSPDEFRYLSGTGTLWSWPGQNPMRWRDPSGRDPWSGDAIGESWMLERGDLSSDQMQSIEVARGGGVLAGFMAMLGLTVAPALETGVAMGLQRGLMSSQGSARALARAAVVAIGGAKTCAAPSGGTGGGGSPAPAINVGARGLSHVLARHFAGGAQTAGKSLFGAGETVPGLASAAESVTPVLQSGGNFARIVNAGRAIGIDRATGLPTTTYTVITDAAGNLVTMFPGTP